MIEMILLMLHHKQVHNNLLHDKRRPLNFQNVLVPLYPKSVKTQKISFYFIFIIRKPAL